MPSDPQQRYKDLTTKVAELKQDVAKAQGALDQVKSQIKEEFGYDNLKEARAGLEELEAKEAKLKKQFETKLEEFEREWGPQLEVVPDESE